ncbi:hypothetical protein [Agriterribacter sp.]|uniref:hypothetical protein n=1 Tax=Agriterribacter sp. TaxID=2821509 RepID=UPI002C17DA8C|nr:hypothetical protein [Agriterribacter sp.]HRP56700.1 hypothetical protein [Agriterribacter sp.]
MASSPFSPRAAWLSFIISGLITISSCQKEMSAPPRQTITLPAPAGSGSSFVIESDNIVSTANGFDFTGTLNAKTDDGSSFAVGEGSFKVVTNSDSSIASFSGVGMAEFPNVGIFSEIRNSMAWEKIKSHIEYETGSYYIQNYGTDIPLAEDQKYLHIRVFNEDTGDKFQLRNVANSIIYSFVDFYLDPKDPAVFFKTQLYKPGGNAKEAANTVSRFWKKAADKLVALGKEGFEYADATGLTIGISNNGLFLSKPYDFKISDPETFKQNFGFDRFMELPSHLFFRLAGIPIPSTGVLQLSGESYVHYPVGSLIPPLRGESIKDKYTDAVDWFLNDEQNGYMVSFTGSVDPGGKGIGLVLGMLPNINKIVGREIFNEDFDFDITGATTQWQIPGPNQLGNGQVPSFYRFGGEIKTPVVAEIFGERIKKYLFAPPGMNSFFYCSIGPEIEDIRFLTESEAHMQIPYFGEIDFGRSSFMISAAGIEFTSRQINEIGPLHLSKEITGSLSPEGFELSGSLDNNITLANGVELSARQMSLTLSSDSGITFNGTAVLPFGLGEAEGNGTLRKEGVSISGKLRAGAEIILDNGMRLPTADMSFSASTDPAEGVQLEGGVDIPHLGFVHVKGKINTDDFLLEGEVKTADIAFGDVKLPSANGIVRISKATGVFFKTELNLGIILETNILAQGAVNANGITLTGSISRSVRIAGNSFTFSGGRLTAGPTGVKLSGNIDLSVFKVNVSGDVYGVDDFLLKGNYNYNTQFVKTNIGVAVTPQKINLSGQGTVYGLLGKELYSGGLIFEPNWSASTINICYMLSGVKYCVGL